MKVRYNNWRKSLQYKSRKALGIIDKSVTSDSCYYHNYHIEMQASNISIISEEMNCITDGDYEKAIWHKSFHQLPI